MSRSPEAEAPAHKLVQGCRPETGRSLRDEGRMCSIPTDEEIMYAVCEFGGTKATYVIRNILSMSGFRNIKTPWVLHQLKRLERDGRVVRVPSSYAVMLCWSAATPAPKVGVMPSDALGGEVSQTQSPPDTKEGI